MPKKISAIACNYNGAEFIQDAVESVLANQDPNLELIVVDDGSTDSSREVLSQYQNDARVKLVFQENSGQPGAFNAGVAAAQGDWVCLFDGDDFWFPHKARALRGAVETLGLGDEPWLVRHPLLDLFEIEEQRQPAKLIAYDTPTGEKRLRLGELKLTLTPKECIASVKKDGFSLYGGGNFGGSTFMSRAMGEAVFPLPLLSKYYGDMMPLFSGPLVGNFYILARYLGAYRFHGTNHSLTRKLEPIEFWDGMSKFLNGILQNIGEKPVANFRRSIRARPYLMEQGYKDEALKWARQRLKENGNWVEYAKTLILATRAKSG